MLMVEIAEERSATTAAPGESAMTSAGSVTADTIVEDLLTAFPGAARVFVRRRMHCVGCDMARFETVAEVCRIYNQPLDVVLEELRRIAQDGARTLDAPCHDPSPTPSMALDRGEPRHPAWKPHGRGPRSKASPSDRGVGEGGPRPRRAPSYPLPEG
jgi:hybrid cluster-associated redox disulfide protein